MSQSFTLEQTQERASNLIVVRLFSALTCELNRTCDPKTRGETTAKVYFYSNRRGDKLGELVESSFEKQVLMNTYRVEFPFLGQNLPENNLGVLETLGFITSPTNNASRLQVHIHSPQGRAHDTEITMGVGGNMRPGARGFEAWVGLYNDALDIIESKLSDLD